jgi:hypothetical protein
MIGAGRSSEPGWLTSGAAFPVAASATTPAAPPTSATTAALAALRAIARDLALLLSLLCASFDTRARLVCCRRCRCAHR